MIKYWIGIDVSKDTLDLVLRNGKGVLAEARIANSGKALKDLLKKWCKQFDLHQQEYLVCLEPTSYYVNIALQVLSEQGIATWLIHCNDLRQSLGMQRGKSDKIDARRIAEYGWRFQDKARLYTLDQIKMNKLRQLLTRRQKYTQLKAMFQRWSDDMVPYMDKDLQKGFRKDDKGVIEKFNELIKNTDQKILKVIQADAQIKEMFDLLKSVPGVGNVLAAHLLALTDGFTRFTDPRKLACHAGCAPFENRSGTSLKGRSKVSHHANHTLKSLLHMSVVSQLRLQGELRNFYDRKVEEGKHKMLVLNALRNKLIHRVCAVIKRGTPYELRTPLANVIE
jgi:transposase